MDLPRGKRILSEKIENISSVHDRIPAGFRGMIRIFMKYDGRLHSCDILVNDKSIIGISLDDLDKNKSVFGEEAFTEVKLRLPEAKGDVDLHQFSDVEMSLALSTNERILLRPGLPLVRFKELGSPAQPTAQSPPPAPPAPAKRPEDDRRRVEEDRRKAEEQRKRDEEQRRRDEEARRRDEEQRKRDEEARRRDEDRRRKESEEQRRREEEEAKKREASKPKPSEPAQAAKKPEDEEWMKELGKLDEEWGKLEDEWKKLESIKGLSLEEGSAKPAAKSAELSAEEKAVLDTRPVLAKGIGFADKLRLLRFPNASNAVGMLDGKKSVGEISDELKIDKKTLVDLVKELTKRGYVK